MSDNPDKASAPWQGEIPELDYWRFRTGNGIMNNAQTSFYLFLRSNLEAGRKVDIDDAHYGYVSVLKDEIIRKFNSPLCRDRGRLVEMARNLIDLYGYTGYDLDGIIGQQDEINRKNRIKTVSSKQPAQWIPYGTTLKLPDGRVLVRGGFYIGTHLELSQYNIRRGEFSKKTEIVEGPVIPISDIDCLVRRNDSKSGFSTFVEMSRTDRDSLIGWLAGNEGITPNALMYYLAGWEFRLFGDASVSLQERAAMIMDLIEIVKLEILPTFPPFFFTNRTLETMIDLAVGLFFPEKSEMFPDILLEAMPLSLRFRARNIITDLGVPKTFNHDHGRIIAERMPVPRDLPEVFHEDFFNRLSSSLVYYLNYKGLVRWVNDSETTYTPICRAPGYVPSLVLQNALKFSFNSIEYSISMRIERLMNAYEIIVRELKYFLQAVRSRGGLMAQIRALPYWLDSSKLPGFDKAAENLRPADDEAYRLVPTKDLLKEIGVYEYFKDRGKIDNIEGLEYELEKFGLMLAYPDVSYLNLGLDGEVAIIEQESGKVPTRGHLIICEILLAWFLQSDKVSEADYAIADAWIDDWADNSSWAGAAKGFLRSLVSQRLVMSGKRKSKAAALGKTVKRRQGLVNCMLRIFSNPEAATAKRLKRLTAIYEMLGLNPEDIHADMHRLATEGDFKKKTRKSTIDKSRLKEMTHNTLRAQEILAEVFDKDTDEQQAPAKPARNKSAGKKTAKAGKKTSPLKSLLQQLAATETWPHSDFDVLCRSLGMTSGATLEQLNDLSYEHFDESVADDDGDTIFIETSLASQLLEKM